MVMARSVRLWQAVRLGNAPAFEQPTGACRVSDGRGADVRATSCGPVGRFEARIHRDQVLPADIQQTAEHFRHEHSTMECLRLRMSTGSSLRPASCLPPGNK